MKKLLFLFLIVTSLFSCKKEELDNDPFKIKFEGNVEASHLPTETSGPVITLIEYSKKNSISDTVKDQMLGLNYPGIIIMDTVSFTDKEIIINDIDYNRPIRISVRRFNYSSSSGLSVNNLNNYKIYKGINVIGVPLEGDWDNGISY